MTFNERLRIAHELIEIDTRVNQEVKQQLHKDALLGEFYLFVHELASANAQHKNDENNALGEVLEGLIFDLVNIDTTTDYVHRYIRYKDIQGFREIYAQTNEQIIMGY